MKKAFKFIKSIVGWAAVLLSVIIVVFTVVSVTTVNRNDISLLGYKTYIVLSESMSKTDFSAGDLIVVKEVEDCALLKEGDIISYISQNTSNYGQTVTHKIRKKTTDDNGKPGFITYGTTTDSDDEMIVTYPYVLGLYQFNIPKAGLFFDFLKSTQGYLLCVFVPFVLLIGVQAVNCIEVYKKYKQEQLEKAEKNKQELQQEREKNKKLTEEIYLLKKELEEKNKIINLIKEQKTHLP